MIVTPIYIPQINAKALASEIAKATGDNPLHQTGYREGDISGVLENLVFLELKRRGYQVYIGKFDNREIDFIAEKENRKIYIQVAYLLESQQTIEREFSVLKSINDNYPKYVISMDDIFGRQYSAPRQICRYAPGQCELHYPQKHRPASSPLHVTVPCATAAVAIRENSPSPTGTGWLLFS